MKCFTPERVLEFEAGKQVTSEEEEHMLACDVCTETWMEHSVTASEPSMIWDDVKGWIHKCT